MSSQTDPGALHFVNVGARGAFASKGKWKNSKADVDNIIDRLRSGPTRRVVLHIHGGLVDEEYGMESAARLKEQYQQADCYPIFIVWQTGLFETLKKNLNSIHKTKLFQKVLVLVIRYVVKKTSFGFGAKGPGELPTEEEVAEELTKEVPFEELDKEISTEKLHAEGVDLETLEDELRAEIEAELQSDFEIVDILEEEQKQPETELLDDTKLFPKEKDDKGPALLLKATAAAVKISYRVVRRIFTDRHHGYYCTTVEEILRELYMADLSEWVWDGMKEAAHDMWQPNDGLDDEELHASRYLWDELGKLQQACPDLTVDVVGHSAGAIVICQMFAAAATSNAGPASNAAPAVRNVFFLAPACTTELMCEQIVKHTDRYDRFVMYAMNDNDEQNDPLLKDYKMPDLYPRSLLYFVSGVSEEEVDMPLAGMHRFHQESPRNDSEASLAELRPFLYGNVRRVALSGEGNEPGFETGSFSHGGFDEDELTHKSLRHFIT